LVRQLGMSSAGIMAIAFLALLSVVQAQTTTDTTTTATSTVPSASSTQVLRPTIPVTESPTGHFPASVGNITNATAVHSTPSSIHLCANGTAYCLTPEHVSRCYSLTDTIDLSDSQEPFDIAATESQVVQIVSRAPASVVTLVSYHYQISFDLGLSSRIADIASTHSVYITNADTCLNTVQEKGTFCGDHNLYHPVVNSYYGVPLERRGGGGVRSVMTYALDTYPTRISCDEVFHEPWWDHDHVYDRCCEGAGHGICHQAALQIGAYKYLANGTVPATRAFDGGQPTVWQHAVSFLQSSAAEMCTHSSGLIPTTTYNGHTFQPIVNPQMSYPMYRDCKLNADQRRAFVFIPPPNAAEMDVAHGRQLPLVDFSYAFGIDIISQAIPTPSLYRFDNSIVASNLSQNSSFSVRDRSGAKGMFFHNATKAAVSLPEKLVHARIPVVLSDELITDLDLLPGTYYISIDGNGTLYITVQVVQGALTSQCSPYWSIQLLDSVHLPGGTGFGKGQQNVSTAELALFATGAFLECQVADDPRCPAVAPFYAPTPFYADTADQMLLGANQVGTMSTGYTECGLSYTKCLFVGDFIFCQVSRVGARLSPRDVGSTIKSSAQASAFDTYMSASDSSVAEQVDMSMRAGYGHSLESSVIRQEKQARDAQESLRISSWRTSGFTGTLGIIMAQASVQSQQYRINGDVRILAKQSIANSLSKSGTPVLGPLGSQYSLRIIPCHPVRVNGSYYCGNQTILYFDTVGACFSASCSNATECKKFYKEEHGARVFASQMEYKASQAASYAFPHWDFSPALYSHALGQASATITSAYVAIRNSQVVMQQTAQFLAANLHRQETYANNYHGAEDGSQGGNFGENLSQVLMSGLGDVWSEIKKSYDYVSGLLGRFTPFSSAFWNLILIIITVVIIGWLIAGAVGLYLKKRQQKRLRRTTTSRWTGQEETTPEYRNPLFVTRPGTMVQTRVVNAGSDAATEAATVVVQDSPLKRALNNLASIVTPSAAPQPPTGLEYAFIAPPEVTYEVAGSSFHGMQIYQCGRTGYSVVYSTVSEGYCLRVLYDGKITGGGNFGLSSTFASNFLPGSYRNDIFISKDSIGLATMSRPLDYEDLGPHQTFSASRRSSDLQVVGHSAATATAWITLHPSMVARIGSQYIGVMTLKTAHAHSVLKSAAKIPTLFVAGWERMSREILACASLAKYVREFGNATLDSVTVTEYGPAYNMTINGQRYFTHPLLCTSLPVVLSEDETSTVGGSGTCVVPKSFQKQSLQGVPSGILEVRNTSGVPGDVRSDAEIGPGPDPKGWSDSANTPEPFNLE